MPGADPLYSCDKRYGGSPELLGLGAIREGGHRSGGAGWPAPDSSSIPVGSRACIRGVLCTSRVAEPRDAADSR